MRLLFLDDIRSPGDVTWIAIHNGRYDVVRTQPEFEAYLLQNGIPNVISFDNDLGIGDGEGIECAKWMVERIMDGDLVLPDDFRYTVHSKNPVAEKRIKSLLDSFIPHWRAQN